MEFLSVREFKTKKVCLQSWVQSKDSEFCLCLERGNTVNSHLALSAPTLPPIH